MTPSPRKRARTAFAQTWHETDASSFDPAALPITKAPRSWERKVETMMTTGGKQKKVARRHNTRSKAAKTSRPEDMDEEEPQDPRSRPTKKLQLMRPDETEEVSALPKRKKRVFKATQTDRRKSVLPRKQIVTRHDAPIPWEETIETHKEDIHAIDANDSVVEDDSVVQGEPVPALASIIKADRRRSTFTFTLEDTKDMRLEYHAPTEPEPFADLPSEVATTTTEHSADPMPVEDEEECGDVFALGDKSLGGEVVERSVIAETKIEEDTIIVDDEERVVSVEGGADSPQNHELEDVDAEALADPSSVDVQAEVAQTLSDDVPEEIAELQQTSTIAAVSPIQGAMSEENNCEDHEMSEINLDLDILGPSDEETSGIEDEQTTPEEAREDTTLTEASLQLDIQRNMELSEIQEKEHTSNEPVPTDELIAETANEKITADAAKLEETVKEDAGNDERTPEFDEKAQSPAKATPSVVDIADGLTLRSSSLTSTIDEPFEAEMEEDLPSDALAPCVSPDDVTSTIQMDDDTALLQGFLTRAAASKANKTTVMARRESLQNRRDSGAIRQALASPRKILEDKDPNSPSKYDNDFTLDLSQTLTLNMDQSLLASPTRTQEEVEREEGLEEKLPKTSRRSSRAKKSKLPAPSSASSQSQAPKIAVRRADGGEPIVLKKTEAQELALMTRANTRKNKQGALAVNVRLLKLKLDTKDNAPDSPGEFKTGKRNVHWDETLAYYQEGTDTLANMMADAQSLATPDELSVPTTTASLKKKTRETKETTTETPRKVRRLRGLGAANGTPGKGLLAPATILPESLADEKELPPAEKSVRPASRLKKLVIAPTTNGEGLLASPARKVQLPPSPRKAMPPLELNPIGLDLSKDPVKDTKAAKERKSRLATPKRVKLPQPTSSIPSLPVPVDGKENQANLGIRGASPKKGLKLPEVVVPPIAECGLPRRRAPRKL